MAARTLTIVVVLGLCACWTKQVPVAAAPPVVARDLATVEAVLEAALVARGGRPALAAITSSRSSGVLITPNGVTAKLTILARSGQVLTTIEVKGLGTIRQGVSGDIVWEVSTRGARILTGSERAQQLREAAFDTDRDWRALYARSVFAGVVDVDGQRAYKIVHDTHEGDRESHYYSYATRLLIREEKIVASQLATIPVVTTFSDYRDVAGTKHPHHVFRSEGPTDSMTITLDTIELNPVFFAGAFDLPAEVAALQ